MTKQNILIATGNQGKVREIRRILEPHFRDLRFVTLANLDPIEAPEETGQTFTENAELKAKYYARVSGLPSIADDSGLEVEALDGAPGVFSARFSGPDATDEKNNVKLIEALAPFSGEERGARYRAVIVLAKPSGNFVSAEGQTKGRIVDEPKGKNGFGYDPHFFVPELNRTFAEISPAEKDARSHRAKALEALIPQIEAFLD